MSKTFKIIRWWKTKTILKIKQKTEKYFEKCFFFKNQGILWFVSNHFKTLEFYWKKFLKIPELTIQQSIREKMPFSLTKSTSESEIWLFSAVHAKEIDPSYMKTKFEESTGFKCCLLEKKVRNTNRIAQMAKTNYFGNKSLPSSVNTIPGELPLLIQPIKG